MLQSKPKYWNLCDIRSGFWQVYLRKRSRPLTAFTSPETALRYQYCVTTFGLQCSPAAMMTLLNNLFAGMQHSHGIWIYMDDLATVSSDWQSNLHNLKTLLEILRTNSLTCKPEKCEFAQFEVEYLEFKISSQGLEMSDRRLKIIEAIQPPTNRKSLQRLIGLFTFWKKIYSEFFSTYLSYAAIIEAKCGFSVVG